MSRTGIDRGSPAELDLGFAKITDQEFALFRQLVERETGIQLPESKRPLLVGRLACRLRDLRLDSFGAYYRRLTKEGDEAERIRMIDLVSTNETSFFREPVQFDYLERQLIPEWTAAAAAKRRPRSLRIWSAACASGEEPYSVAMVLLYHLPDWKLDILATDISTRALDRAREGRWPIQRSSEIPERYLKAFMLRGIGANLGTMKAGSELLRCVRFDRLNLHEARYQVGEGFDLILCRNVLIYFSTEGRLNVVRRLLEHLDPRGYLFVGHAETLSGLDDRLRYSGPTIYSRRVDHGTPDASRAPKAHR